MVTNENTEVETYERDTELSPEMSPIGRGRERRHGLEMTFRRRHNVSESGSLKRCSIIRGLRYSPLKKRHSLGKYSDWYGCL
ncbi:MAG: hypothetical protein NTU63_00730 [Candidatus Pacearchaeota archaeon]|nr:hypothetical protein [Candidatus Pacearchaeota archaeon]